jgi:enhancer of polycomb-like protein
LYLCWSHDQPQAIRLAKERLGIANGHIVEDVYKYWQGKRARLRKPLLRRFWPATSPTDVNPHNVFRPRDKGRYNTRRQKKNDLESFTKMQQLREDLDRARSLLDYTRQREKLKLESLKLRIECFEQVRGVSLLVW